MALLRTDLTANPLSRREVCPSAAKCRPGSGGRAEPALGLRPDEPPAETAVPTSRQQKRRPDRAGSRNGGRTSRRSGSRWPAG